MILGNGLRQLETTKQRAEKIFSANARKIMTKSAPSRLTDDIAKPIDADMIAKYEARIQAKGFSGKRIVASRNASQPLVSCGAPLAPSFVPARARLRRPASINLFGKSLTTDVIPSPTRRMPKTNISTFSLDPSEDTIVKTQRSGIRRLIPGAAAHMGGAGLHRDEEQLISKKLWKEQDQLQLEIEKGQFGDTLQKQMSDSRMRRTEDKQQMEAAEKLEQDRMQRQRAQMDAKYESELMAAGEYGRLRRFREERARQVRQQQQLKRRQEAAIATKKSLSSAGWSFFQEGAKKTAAGKKRFGTRRSEQILF